MTEDDGSNELPGVEPLAALLAMNVETFDAAELKRYLKTRRFMFWRRNDQHVKHLFEELGSLVRFIRDSTGWTIEDILHVIGCQKHGGALNSEHLEVAERQTRKLATAVSEIHEILGDGTAVDVAFRCPPGDSFGDLRSMSEEQWARIRTEARVYANKRAYSEDGGTEHFGDGSRRALRAAAERFAG